MSGLFFSAIHFLGCNTFWHQSRFRLAWENSRHFATTPLVSPRNDVLETSVEIPYWWRDTTQIDLSSASDWLKQISQAARPIRSASQILALTRHQYGISALASQTSFRGETVGSVAECRLFSQARFRWTKNSLHFATLRTVSPRNGVWRTSSEIPHR